MKVLIEQYSYDRRTLERLLDSHYYCERENGKAQVPYVGYFLSKKIPDTVFILPKVFIIDGKAFGKYTPEDIVDFESLSEEDKKTIFSLSVWIYRAIKLYLQRKERFADETEIMQNVVSHHGDSSETMIDIVLSLLKFQREHQNLFTFITKLHHSGNNKIHWQKTISGTQAMMQNRRPVYLTPKTKQKEVNFDEELIVLFYSVLNYLNTEFHFNTRPVFGYELIKPAKIKDMVTSGKGTRILRQNRRKYFTDEMVALWNLLFTFFSESETVENKQNSNEQAMLVRDFNLVFEDMIDSLIGEDNLPSGLKEQKDGKIIDHIYRDNSLIDAKDDIYFIGDSKYYKEDNEVGKNSIYKQFTYARNVIQYNIDFYHDKGHYDEGLKYRDEATEGYNITPNFFIRGNLDKNSLNNYTDDNLNKIGDDHVSYHFENRLFDRDTLILQTYNINFLFVLSAYVQGARQHTERIRRVFRENVKTVLNERYHFYAIKPKVQKEADKYLRDNFQDVLGKIYAPYDKEKTNCLSLALDVDEKFSEANKALRNKLGQYFYIEEITKEIKLDCDPETLFDATKQTKEASSETSKRKRRNGVLMVMMENFEAKSKNFLESGEIAVALKNTNDSKEIRDNIQNIGYILFHTRKDDGTHLFSIEQAVIAGKLDIGDAYPTTKSDNANVTGYVVASFNGDLEIPSTGIYPTNKPALSRELRYDAQYAMIEELKGNSINI
ncbi:MAG: restriction endonuclease [Bacteroidales bacterium]|nr:restriction endonuclease [Bacteroidales bacterium]